MWGRFRDVFAEKEMKEQSAQWNWNWGKEQPLPGVTLEQVNEEWPFSVRSTSGGVSRWLHRRRGEGDCATDSQHSRPSSFPHERHWELHVRRCHACSGMCQLLHGVHGPPSSFIRQNHELAPARRSKFRIRCLLILKRLQQNGSVVLRGVWVRFTVATERTAQRDVNCQRRNRQNRAGLGRGLRCASSLGAGTLTFMSRRNTFCRTHAPASPNTRAVMRLMGGWLVFSHDLVQEARWRPNESRGTWQPSHCASVIWSGSCNRLRQQRAEQVWRCAQFPQVDDDFVWEWRTSSEIRDIASNTNIRRLASRAIFCRQGNRFRGRFVATSAQFWTCHSCGLRQKTTDNVWLVEVPQSVQNVVVAGVPMVGPDAVMVGWESLRDVMRGMGNGSTTEGFRCPQWGAHISGRVQERILNLAIARHARVSALEPVFVLTTLAERSRSRSQRAKGSQKTTIVPKVVGPHLQDVYESRFAVLQS